MRKLAYVSRVDDLVPIEGADRIELAVLRGWRCVVKKGEFNVGDLGVFHEIDSFLDETNPAYEFMRDKKFRVKSMKLKGVISQGLLLPLSILGEVNDKVTEGYDLTETLNVKHWDDINPENFSGTTNTTKKNNFPKCFNKTTEERCIDGDTVLVTVNGPKTIKNICETKYDGSVLSYNIYTGILSFERVNNWNISDSKKEWIEIETESGRVVKLTSDHRVWLDSVKCYRQAKDLVVGDELTIGF